MQPEQISLPQVLSVKAGSVPDSFIGTSDAYGRMGIYGGHFLGQALAAGFETVAKERRAQSLHAYFLLAGDPSVEIEYKVQRLREGRYSDTRNISAYQSGKMVFQMLAAFKNPEPGDEHQSTMPKTTSPEQLAAKLALTPRKFTPPMMLGGRTELMAISETFAPEKFIKGRPPVLQSWMRSTHQGTIDEQMAQCILAFLSDGTLMFNSVLPHGIPFSTHHLTTLDHSMWFHRSCDVSQWLLFDQKSTAAADSRGFNSGEVFDRQGRLIFTATQESMLRKLKSFG